MSNQPPQGLQLPAIFPFAPFGQTSFDLNKLDAFSNSLGIDFEHWKCLSSPIGLKGRGEYRRENGVDVLSSNGMLYFCSGTFTACMTDNNREKNRLEQGILDPSHSRLVMSRFYKNADGTNNTTANPTRIYLAPGDRLYLADKNADVRVPKSQEMTYEQDVDNVTTFPIWEMDPNCPLIDSTGQTYSLGTDFCITKDGNIRWLTGGRNPGIDPDTGAGRVYAIRYFYRAFWYVLNMLKEIRITNVTEGSVRVPERMPEHVLIIRENVFHDQNRGSGQELLKSKTPQRQDAPVVQTLNITQEPVNVDITNFGMPDQSDNGE